MTNLLDRNILELFLPSDAAAVGIAAHIVKAASWSFILMGATLVLSSLMRANGATLVPLVIMILASIREGSGRLTRSRH